jgi:Mg2+-importing ATPase
MPKDVQDPASPRSPLIAGLTSAEARDRLRRFGPNDLVPPSKQTRFWSWLVKLVTDPMAILLVVTAATYASFGDRLDAVVASIALVPIFTVSAVLEVHADAAGRQSCGRRW